MSNPNRLDPRKRRASKSVTITFDNGEQVIARKLDMTMALMQGVTPMPLLSAAQQILKGGEVNQDNALNTFDSISDKDEIITMLRRHALVVVIDPVVVEREDGNPEHMPVDLFDFFELMEIWKATAILPKVAPAKATEFRREEPANDAAPAHDGEDVRDEAERVGESADNPDLGPAADAGGETIAEFVDRA